MNKKAKQAAAIGIQSPIHQLVLNKIEFEDIDRSQISIGETDFNFDLHVEGSFKVSADHWQVCWHKVRPLAILAFALDKLNVDCRKTVLKEGFDWYMKLTEEQREQIEAKISGELKEVEAEIKSETENDRQVVQKNLDDCKNVTKDAVNDIKCWGIQKYNGRVTFKDLKVEVKE